MNYASIPSEIWVDPFFCDLSPEDKYFILYVLTNPHTQKCGCYLLHPRIAAAESGYNNETIAKLIDRLTSAEWILHDPITKEILVLRWPELNPGFFAPGSKVRAAIAKECRKIRSTRLRDIVLKWLMPDADAPSMPHQSPIDAPIQYTDTYTSITKNNNTKLQDNVVVHPVSPDELQKLFEKIPDSERSDRLDKVILSALQQGVTLEIIESNINYAIKCHKPLKADGNPQSLGGFMLASIKADFARSERIKSAERNDTGEKVRQQEYEDRSSREAIEAKELAARIERHKIWEAIPKERREQLRDIGLRKCHVLGSAPPFVQEEYLALMYFEGDLTSDYSR